MEDALNFVCSSKDCEQKSFSGGKQMTAHKRRHDMVLCLNKPNQYSSDQTPTPTRFIRNCEAIGLFQDLQNVNPFDENFKRATEAVKKGENVWIPSISLGKAAGEDLHTPHVDLTDDTQSSNNGNEDDDVEHVIQSEADTSNGSCSNLPLATSNSLSEEVRKGITQAAQDLRIFVRMPDGVLVQISTIPNIGIHTSQSPSIIIPTQALHNGNSKQQDMQPNPQTTNVASADVKQKLKAALLKTGKLAANEDNSQRNLPPVSPSTNHHATINEGKREKKVTSSTSGDEDCERKRKTLERNRIAAMRCREKRKKWVAELKDKYDKMCTTNEVLLKEVTFLRSEVARLKGLLLASSCGQNQDITTVQFVPALSRRTNHAPIEVPNKAESLGELNQASGRIGREGLCLDIEGAKKVVVMDLDSPLVRKDEILSSVAPPTTPNEKLISFPELDRESEADVSEDKMLTTVIQINPNALSRLPSTFS